MNILRDATFKSILEYATTKEYKLSRKRLINTSLSVFSFMLIASVLLYMNIVIALIIAIISVLVYNSTIFRKIIALEAERTLSKNCNKFINLTTQLLSNPYRAFGQTFELSAARLTETNFKIDMNDLQLLIANGDNQSIISKFDELQRKYANDIVFVFFLEQLETRYHDGDINFKVLEDIQNYHNEIKTCFDKYVTKKDTYRNEYFIINCFSFVTVLLIGFGFGIEQYIEYVRSLLGIAVNSIFLILCLAIYFKFINMYLDEDLTMSKD